MLSRTTELEPSTKDKVAELEAVNFLIKVKEPLVRLPKAVAFFTPLLFSLTTH